MEAGQSLRIPVISRSRFDEKALKEAVMYILSKDNVVPISWGTKDIKLTDNETVTLPALTRQKTPKHLYDNYTWPSAMTKTQMLLVSHFHPYLVAYFMRF